MRTYEFDVMGPLERTRTSTSGSGVYITVLVARRRVNDVASRDIGARRFRLSRLVLGTLAISSVVGVHKPPPSHFARSTCRMVSPMRAVL